MEDSDRRLLLEDMYRQRGGLTESVPRYIPMTQSNNWHRLRLRTAFMDMWLTHKIQRAAEEAARE